MFFKIAFSFFMIIINAVGKYRSTNWGKRPVSAITKLVVHHSAIAQDSRSDDQRMRAIQNVHQSQSWAGLSYHFVITRNGNIYQTNDFDDLTWTDTENTNSLSVLVDRYFHDNKDKPTTEQLRALEFLLTKLCNEHPEFPAVRKDVIGHRDVIPTACPGDSLYSHVVKFRNEGFILDNNNNNQNNMSDQKEIAKPFIGKFAEILANKNLPFDSGRVQGLVWSERDFDMAANELGDRVSWAINDLKNNLDSIKANKEQTVFDLVQSKSELQNRVDELLKLSEEKDKELKQWEADYIELAEWKREAEEKLFELQNQKKEKTIFEEIIEFIRTRKSNWLSYLFGTVSTAGAVPLLATSDLQTQFTNSISGNNFTFDFKTILIIIGYLISVLTYTKKSPDDLNIYNQ
jgi:hypothetical protein